MRLFCAVGRIVPWRPGFVFPFSDRVILAQVFRSAGIGVVPLYGANALCRRFSG
jgi:hypothetical protein